MSRKDQDTETYLRKKIDAILNTKENHKMQFKNCSFIVQAIKYQKIRYVFLTALSLESFIYFKKKVLHLKRFRLQDHKKY